MKTEALQRRGKRVVVLGDEAIARGAIETGVGVVTAYPGTPTSEIATILAKSAKELGYYFEYSTNEKVALETATGAAWSGVRAMVTMKHFGLNVASDSLLPIAYVGTRAGLVIVVGDDPEGFSSIQSEEDSRYYGLMARLPILEPANPKECLDYTNLAFKISEEFKLPVILRITTKVAHSIGPINLGQIKKPKVEGVFKKEPTKFYSFRPALQELHHKLDEKLTKIEQKYGFILNKVHHGGGEIGVITSGVSFEYAKEISGELGINPPIAKISLTNPLSEKFIINFIKEKSAILVLEELEPIVEDFVKKVAKDVNPKIKIYGKDLLKREGEYNLERILPAFQKIFKRKYPVDLEKHTKLVSRALSGLPPRKSLFCPGCPHRSTFYAVKQIFPNAIYAGDIGCYMMGIFEPYEMQDFIISMGAGVSLAHGITRVSNQEVIAFIGDSTFYHAGMPALLNCSYNDERSPIIIILDNGITAMTGHQPHPSAGFTGMGEKVNPVNLESICRNLGAKEIKIANAFSQNDLEFALKTLKAKKGLRVLISKGECRIVTKRKMREKGIPMPKFEVVGQKEFQKSGLLDNFSCPAMKKIKGKYLIDDECLGCGVCPQICPKGIKVKG